MGYFFFFAAILAFMYLVLVRPQQQRLRKQQALVRAVAVGDYVVLQSGIVGRVADETTDRLQLEISDGVLVEVLKVAVFRKMEPSELAFSAPADEEAAEEAESGEEDPEAVVPEAVVPEVDNELDHDQLDDSDEGGRGEGEEAEGETEMTAPEQDTH